MPPAALKNEESSKILPLTQIPMGLTVKGLIMEKISGTTKNGDPTHHLSVAVKGLNGFLKIKVPEQFFMDCVEMTPYSNTIVFSEFNGRIYWQESDL